MYKKIYERNIFFINQCAKALHMSGIKILHKEEEEEE